MTEVQEIKVERQKFIPASEMELAEARDGDLVKISYKFNSNGLVSSWTLYKGNNKGIDSFRGRWQSKLVEDKNLIVTYSSERKYLQFDRNLGVIFSTHHSHYEFIASRREEYKAIVEELKKAELWGKR